MGTEHRRIRTRISSALDLAGAVARRSLMDVLRAVVAPVVGVLLSTGAGLGPLPGAIAGGLVSAALYLLRHTGLELTDRQADRDERERGQLEMRRIADFARELLLETTIWDDAEGYISWVQAQEFSTKKMPPPRE